METEERPKLKPKQVRPTVSTACINRLVQRTGCTIRDAEVTLQGRTLEEQQQLSESGRADARLVFAHKLEAALAQLRAAKIDPASQCPFGAVAKRGPDGRVLVENGRRIPVPQTWGDVAARLVHQGRVANLAGLIGRVR